MARPAQSVHPFENRRRYLFLFGQTISSLVILLYALPLGSAKVLAKHSAAVAMAAGVSARDI
jgi:hypothetical protein